MACRLCIAAAEVWAGVGYDDGAFGQGDPDGGGTPDGCRAAAGVAGGGTGRRLWRQRYCRERWVRETSLEEGTEPASTNAAIGRIGN